MLPTSSADEQEPATLDDSKAAGTVPYANSLACRRCGSAVAFDDPTDGSDTIVCGACGTTNLIPEEVPPDAAD